MSLLALQRDMMAWLRSGEPLLAERIGGGAGPAIYLNNHRAALMAALANAYVQLGRWMGSEAFEGAAAHHVEQAAPDSWTLDGYGRDFAETLAGLFPGDPELPELARLEWALSEAFTAPDAQALDLSALGAVNWDVAVLRPVPSAVLIKLRTNADAILSALFAEDAPPHPETRADPLPLLVWREGFAPRFRRLEADELRLFAQASDGLSFAALCNDLAEALGPDTGIGRAGTLLARWAGEGSCGLA